MPSWIRAKLTSEDRNALRALTACGKLNPHAFGGVMKSPGCAIFLGIAVAVCCGAPASSAAIKSLPGKHGVVIQISGQIADGDADAFISEVKRANAAGKVVENVQLNSSGGKLLEGVKLAAAIREGKISTSVAQGGGLCIGM